MPYSPGLFRLGRRWCPYGVKNGPLLHQKQLRHFPTAEHTINKRIAAREEFLPPPTGSS